MAGNILLKKASFTLPVIPYADFETDLVAPAWREGRIFYDDEFKTLSVYNNEENVTLQLGQEMYVRGTNKTGATILNGKLVYVSGAIGSRPQISLAKADAVATYGVLGMATHDILDNRTGFVTVSGLVHFVDTSGIAAGSALFLSAATAGEFTDTEPINPNHIVRIGRCLYENKNDGIIFISISPMQHKHSHIADAPGDTAANNAITINAILSYLEDAGMLEAS